MNFHKKNKIVMRIDEYSRLINLKCKCVKTNSIKYKIFNLNYLFIKIYDLL